MIRCMNALAESTKTRHAMHTVIIMNSITCMATLFNNHHYISSSDTSVGTKFPATYIEMVVMPQWAEPRRHTVVVMFVRLSVCLCMLFCSALFSSTAINSAMKVAMQLQLNILPPLNWLDFCYKALLSSYNMMCSP